MQYWIIVTPYVNTKEDKGKAARMATFIERELGVAVDEMLIDESYFITPDFATAPSFVGPKWWKDLTC